MNQPAAKPTMHSIGRSSTPSTPAAVSAPRSNNDIIADQVAAILAKRNAESESANTECWTAVDAAKIAVQAASAVRSDRKMIQAEVSDLRTADADTLFAVQHLERKVTGIEARIDASKNNAVLWGVGSAVIAGVMVSLIFAPSTCPSAATQQNQVIERGAQ